jgi:hypothetical protein
MNLEFGIPLIDMEDLVLMASVGLQLCGGISKCRCGGCRVRTAGCHIEKRRKTYLDDIRKLGSIDKKLVVASFRPLLAAVREWRFLSLPPYLRSKKRALLLVYRSVDLRGGRTYPKYVLLAAWSFSFT